MMIPHLARRRGQQGSATLLVALALVMALTVVTLSVARSQLVEQRIANNHHWQTRLFLLSEAGLAKGAQLLSGNAPQLHWQPLRGAAGEISRVQLSGSAPATTTQLSLGRADTDAAFVLLEASSTHADVAGMRVTTRQLLRPLSLLTPLGESAPPLVVNGCLAAGPDSLEVRPLHGDTDTAADAVWLDSSRPCDSAAILDSHRGNIAHRPLGEDLWPTMLSVDRQRFADLAEQQADLPTQQRSYRLATPEDLATGRWLQSSGTPENPVALYFPAEVGCPEFGPGVRIHGLVFIDSDCAGPIPNHALELYGSLMINGNLDTGAGKLRLNHIQAAGKGHSRLRFPVLRSIPVPGTWKDF